MPDIPAMQHRVIRVNDGNDSNNELELVIAATQQYPLKFYNTSQPFNLDKFNAPVVLTVNPGDMTDDRFYCVSANNLMFVRARTNTWNLKLIDRIVGFYTPLEIPIVLTFMAYHTPQTDDYVLRKRTINEYYAIKTKSWRKILNRYKNNIYVDHCGKIEGDNTHCRFCGNCLKHYFACMEKLDVTTR